MFFPSDLISIFGKHDGTQDPTDGVLYVPNSLSPVLEIPQIIHDTYTNDQGSTTHHVDSFLWSSFITVTNGATVTHNFRFGPGVYEIELLHGAVSNFTVIAATSGADFVYTIGASAEWEVSFLYAVNNVPQQVNRKFRCSVQSDDVILTNRVLATGVGQTTTGYCSVSANRLG